MLSVTAPATWTSKAAPSQEEVLFAAGIEHGVEAEGVGVWPGTVERLTADVLPHMGWNTLNVVNNHPLLEGIETGQNGLHSYFVHSFHLVTPDRQALVAEADYGGPVTAMVGKDTMVGTQFHPEKSQAAGQQIIRNFLTWRP